MMKILTKNSNAMFVVPLVHIHDLEEERAFAPLQVQNLESSHFSLIIIVHSLFLAQAFLASDNLEYSSIRLDTEHCFLCVSLYAVSKFLNW